MPTVFSHAVFASAIGIAFEPRKERARFWFLTAICPVIPDADVIAFALGISYRSMWGHRGITHSILFAIIFGLIVSKLFFSQHDSSSWKMPLYFALLTFTHPLLDMFTNGGLGVALFAPVSNERFFFPWRPIEVSPIGVGFFSDRGMAVVMSEVVWIWLPSAAIAVIAWLVRRKR
jgi:inner membrane protein